jgi:hypothetical protein
MFLELLAAEAVVEDLAEVEAELVVLFTVHLNLYLLLTTRLLLAVLVVLVEVFLETALMGVVEQTQPLQVFLMLLVVVAVDLAAVMEQIMVLLAAQGAAAEVGMVQFDAVEVLEL